MKIANSLLLLPIFFAKLTFASSSLTCDFNDFNPSGVKVSIESNLEINKFSASFLLQDSYWSMSIYELSKDEELSLLKDIFPLQNKSLISKKILENYMFRLNDEVNYPNILKESSVINLSNNIGNEYVIEANFDVLHENSKQNEELFVIWVIVRDSKIIFTELHVNHVEDIENTLLKAKKIINEYSNNCKIK